MKREFAALALLAAVFISSPLLVQAKRNPPIIRLTPPVLMYHDVMDIQPQTDPTHQIIAIRPEHLEEQFKYLSENNYSTIFVSQFVHALENHTEIPANTVVITFDDGMSDVYETVVPLLKKYNIKITAFVNPGFDGANGRMTREQLREVYESGYVELGAHTMTHQKLTEITDDEARSEIQESRDEIEKIIGAPITSFAYPFGKFGYREEKMVADSGFMFAFAADDSHGRTHEDFLALPRVTVGEHTTLKSFIRTLQGW